MKEEEPETPCYIIGPKGVSYQDDWCYGSSAYLGDAQGDDEAREIIKAHIRERPERNGIPLYYLSDHGNLHRGRAIRLRVLRAPILAGGEA